MDVDIDDLKPADFVDYERYVRYEKSVARRRNERVIKSNRYPAGRNRTLIVKTVTGKNKLRSMRKNKRRLCLAYISSNPNPIKLVAFKQKSRQYTLWFYPEGRRLSFEEQNQFLSSFLAWRIFVKKARYGLEAAESLGKLHLGTRYSVKSIRIEEKDMVDAVNRQLRRLSRKYSRYALEYSGPVKIDGSDYDDEAGDGKEVSSSPAV